jgi:hypothetical protein
VLEKGRQGRRGASTLIKWIMSPLPDRAMLTAMLRALTPPCCLLCVCFMLPLAPRRSPLEVMEAINRFVQGLELDVWTRVSITCRGTLVSLMLPPPSRQGCKG